jgi:hypothetical protein
MSFYKLRTFVPKDVPKTLYYAFVYSHSLNGVEMYANARRTHLKNNETKLQDLENFAE